MHTPLMIRISFAIAALGIAIALIGGAGTVVKRDLFAQPWEKITTAGGLIVLFGITLVLFYIGCSIAFNLPL